MADRFSLPLMGIGNAARHRPSRLGCVDSLPLMGIGNSRFHARSWPCYCQLITPHGDRKPGWERRGTRGCSMTHYPSWGSETRCSGAAPGSATAAHYPSWGSETAGRPHVGIVVAIDSLPLMGIGNLTVLEVRTLLWGLSLPLMGIGNFQIRPGSRLRPLTHYPSWGSETTRLKISASGTDTHYPSWGSETCSPPRPSTGHRATLITPHGDRKQASALPGRPTPTPHYPSWGSETLDLVNDVRRRSGELITPHGDRKPALAR